MNDTSLNTWGKWLPKYRFPLILLILLILDLYNLVFVDKRFAYEFVVDIFTQGVILLPLYIMHRQQIDNARKLQESEQRYKSLFLYNNAGIYVVNLDGSLNTASPNLLDLLGYTEAEIQNTLFTSLFRPDDVPLVQQTFGDITKGSLLSTSRKLQMRHKDGGYLTFDLSSVPLKANGEIKGVIGFAKDITEFERMQGKLAEVQTQLNNIFGSIDIILWSYDVNESKFLTISPACEKVFGYSPEEYYQYPALWSAQIIDEDKAFVISRMNAASQNNPVDTTLEYRIVHASGEMRWVESRLFSSFDEGNGMITVNGVVLDITHKKLLEKNNQIDLDLAREVQKSVLSRPIFTPEFAIDARYIPSKNLGGDMYAWYRMDEHRYGILIMDVMGHGVSSALICMSTRSLLRGIIQANLSPEEVITELNNHMNRLFTEAATAANFYFTAIYLIVDPKKRTIEYINAGHPSGLLMDEDGEVSELKSSCLPIGLIPELKAEKQTIHYKGPVRLLLYTDGLIESPGRLLKNQMNQVLEVMRGTREEPISIVMDTLLASGKGDKQMEQDDICLICMEIQ
ncbi:SpoIIE family protein phosphatase [Paenibacillus ihuae]|uniref:SpoIIE family protein phosphatase n=1 Tax=Paenibacillus ihuae TaxID=1232431 RepID=UPI0006D57C8A|nr:SpoIIE family protein phosphatase [Paenibacillus ihuae]